MNALTGVYESLEEVETDQNKHKEATIANSLSLHNDASVARIAESRDAMTDH
jgi:hypothetical protein